MTNYTITAKQIQATIVMFWLGSLSVLGVNQEAKQDAWVPILLSFLMFLPLIWLYTRLARLYPGTDLFEILFKIFGKIFGRVIALIYILFSIHLGSMLIRLFAEYIQILNMPETPQALTMILLSLVCIYCVRNGPENIGRISKFAWPIVAVSIIVTFIIGIKDMNFSNIKPIMTADLKTLLKGGYDLSMLPLGQLVLCLSLFGSLSNKVNYGKVMLKALALTISIILLVNLRNIFLLGFPSASMFTFPSYQAVSLVSAGEFFTRIEVVIGVNLMLAGVIKVCVCLHAASLGLAKVMNIKDSRTVIVPCCLLMITFAGLVYASTPDMAGWLKIYPTYAVPFELVLPVVILIGAEIQHKIKSGGPDASKSEKSSDDSSSQQKSGTSGTEANKKPETAS